jgi:hypothetical protein
MAKPSGHGSRLLLEPIFIELHAVGSPQLRDQVCMIHVAQDLPARAMGLPQLLERRLMPMFAFACPFFTTWQYEAAKWLLEGMLAMRGAALISTRAARDA